MFSAMTIRKTVILSKVVTPIETFSPLSGGMRKPKKATAVINMHGMIMLKT